MPRIWTDETDFHGRVSRGKSCVELKPEGRRKPQESLCDSAEEVPPRAE